MARLPNKCLHVMVEGVQCGSPAVRHHRFCYHHKRQRERLLELDAERVRASRNAPFNLPTLEDANSIQLSLTHIMRLLAARQIDHKTASLMLYSLQIATTNLQKTSFDPNEAADPSQGFRPVRHDDADNLRARKHLRSGDGGAVKEVKIPILPQKRGKDGATLLRLGRNVENDTAATSIASVEG